MSSPPHHDVHAMSPMTPRWHPCHLWHRHGINDTIMATMTPHCPELGKDNSGVKQWHNMAQYVIYVIPTSPWRTCYVTHDTTMAPMSPMTQTWNQWHHHGNNDTTLSWAGKGQFWCKTMAQYGTVCNICHPHLTMTYMLCHPWHHDGTHVTYDTDMESMTLSWQQWHHTVLELGKDDSGVKQWHNMAQYVIYVIPTSPWRTCYVTHDTTMAPMSPMTQTWNQWHHHGNNDTTLSWAGKGQFWCKTMAQYGTVCSICHPHLTMTYMLCHPWHHDGTHVTYDTDMESMTPSWQQWHHTVLSWERTILV